MAITDIKYKISGREALRRGQDVCILNSKCKDCGSIVRVKYQGQMRCPCKMYSMCQSHKASGTIEHKVEHRGRGYKDFSLCETPTVVMKQSEAYALNKESLLSTIPCKHCGDYARYYLSGTYRCLCVVGERSSTTFPKEVGERSSDKEDDKGD